MKKEIIKNIGAKAKESIKSLKGNKTIIRGLGVAGLVTTGVVADAGCININTCDSAAKSTTQISQDTKSYYDSIGIKVAGSEKYVTQTPSTPCSTCPKTETPVYPSNNTENNGQAIYFNAGEIKNVPAGTIISGDIEVNGQVLYDNNENTALVVKLLNGASVKAPWGASGLENIPGNVLDQKAEEIAQQIRNTRPNTTVQIVGYDGQIVNPGYRSNYPRTHETPVYPSNTVENGQAVSLSSGETKNVPAGTIVSGDIEVNGQRLYDDNEYTAIVVQLPNGGNVRAPWGASGLENIPANLLGQKAQELAQQIRNTRPGVDVQVITFDSQNPNPGYPIYPIYQKPWLGQYETSPYNTDKYPTTVMNRGGVYNLEDNAIYVVVGDTIITDRWNNKIVERDNLDRTGQIAIVKRNGTVVQAPDGGTLIKLPNYTYIKDVNVRTLVNREWHRMMENGRNPLVYLIDGNSVMLKGYTNGEPNRYYPTTDPEPNPYWWN